MSLLDGMNKKKSSTGFSCNSCGHDILQDLDSGKWFHLIRDTKDICTVSDANKVCKCGNPVPFKINQTIDSSPVEGYTNVGRSNKPKEVVQNDDDNRLVAKPVVSVPKPDDNPIQHVIDYLLVDRSYSVSDANLILDYCKLSLVESLRRQNNQ